MQSVPLLSYRNKLFANVVLLREHHPFTRLRAASHDPVLPLGRQSWPATAGGWPETIANSLMNWRHDRQAYPFNAHPSATHRSPPCRLPPSPACPRHSNRKPRANGAHATYGTACQGDVTAKPARHLVRVGEQLQGEIRGGDRALEALRTARETASPGASQTNKSPVHGPGSFVQWHALRRALAARAAETRRGALPAAGARICRGSLLAPARATPARY